LALEAELHVEESQFYRNESCKHVETIIWVGVIGFKVLTGHGAAVDTTTPAGKLVFGIVAALAEFERELIVERTRAGLASARARGRIGGRPYTMTPAKVRLAMAAMGKPETKVGELCAELGITRQTLYRYVSPDGTLRPDGEKLLRKKKG
jgi:DNA invertase Pin-like site-specific DNA recombinase